jgi:hypothetical protein
VNSYCLVIVSVLIYQFLQNLVMYSLMSGSPFEGTEGNLLRLFDENHNTLQQQQQALVAEMAESKVR